MQPTRPDPAEATGSAIALHGSLPPMPLPHGYCGPAWLPGSGRMIWWTGRVAIGLRHQPPPRLSIDADAHSGWWVQTMMLATPAWVAAPSVVATQRSGAAMPPLQALREWASAGLARLTRGRHAVGGATA